MRRLAISLVLASIISLSHPAMGAETDGMVAHCRLDEMSGTRVDAVDSNDLTVVSTLYTTARKCGNAADIEEGNNAGLIMADNAALSMGDIGLTIAGWLRLETKGAAQYAIATGDGIRLEMAAVVVAPDPQGLCAGTGHIATMRYHKQARSQGAITRFFRAQAPIAQNLRTAAGR